jgi:glycosyltransferase involved in cell wall biosynthesis
MNIILLFTYGISLKDWVNSGLFDREIEFYKQMATTNNLKYHIITYGDNEDRDLLKNYPYLNIYPAYELIKKRNNKYVNFINSFLLAFKLKKQIKSVDIIKTNQLNGSWVAFLLKLVFKKPLIIRTGYDLFEFTLKEKKSLILKIFNYTQTLFSLMFADKYIVASNSDKLFLGKNFYKSKKIQVNPNWVNDLKFNNFMNRFSHKILTVGRLEKQKNLDNLISSLANSSIELDIIGDGSLKNYLVNHAEKSSAKVNFLGKMDFNKLSDIYKDYRIFILSSLYEGNPKVVLEAMSSGALVIAPRNSNTEEIIQDGVNGVLYDSFENLDDIIEQYLNNQVMFDKLTWEAYNSIKSNNLITKIMENELSIYMELDKRNNS